MTDGLLILGSIIGIWEQNANKSLNAAEAIMVSVFIAIILNRSFDKAFLQMIAKKMF